MVKSGSILVAACLLLSQNAHALVEKFWPQSANLDYPIGTQAFPTIVGHEFNHLSFSGDGTYVVVSTLSNLTAGPPHPVDPTSHTYRISADGMLNVVDDTAEESFISSNGMLVVVQDDSSSVLRSVNPDGSSPQQIVARNVRRFSVDNTAQKLAYHTDSQVYSANIDGTNEQLLYTSNASQFINSVHISGNGTKVLFTTEPDGQQPAPVPGDVFVINTDGTGLVQLTNAQADGAGPSAGILGASITSDGGTVVMVKSWQTGIYLIDSDGTDERQIFSLRAEFPVISGNGSTIAFLSSESSLGPNSGFKSVFSFPVNSPSSITQHVPNPGVGFNRQADVETVAISADGTYVFYASPEDFFAGTYTRDFSDVYIYRSTGAAGTGTGGGGTGGATPGVVVPGGIGAGTGPGTTAAGPLSILLLGALAWAGARRRRD